MSVIAGYLRIAVVHFGNPVCVPDARLDRSIVSFRNGTDQGLRGGNHILCAPLDAELQSCWVYKPAKIVYPKNSGARKRLVGEAPCATE